MLAPLEHACTVKLWDAAAGDDPNRVAARMAVDAEEGVTRHLRLTPPS
jgi:hypothetical protein